MQIAVMGQTLNALLAPDERTVENRVRTAVGLGLTHVEPYGGTWPADVDVRKTAEEVRREGDRQGLAFPVFGSGTYIGERGERGTKNLAALKRQIEACQIIGATVLTCAAIDGQPVPP